MKNTYTFVGYDKKLENNGILFPVEVSVRNIANEQLALKEAKKMVKRKFYYLKASWPTDNSSQEAAEKHVHTLKKQEELFSKLIKFMKSK